MKTTFSGTFDCKDHSWTYDFYLKDTALIVNDGGQITLSCPETVIEINDRKGKLYLMKWQKEVAKVAVKKCEQDEEISVSIKRQGKWRKAAFFTRERNEI